MPGCTNVNLIVALRVCDAVLLPPPVGEGVDEGADVPVLVLLLLQVLDPQIRDSHREAVVETAAAW